MADFFGKPQMGMQVTARGALEYRYNTARNQLLLVVVFSAVNLLFQIFGVDMYFLFSAYIPLLLTSFGMLLCGRFPEEFYTGEYADMEILPSAVFVVLAVVSFLIIAAYLLFWFLSKKQKVAWMIVALVFFALDSLLMLLFGGISFDMLFDILFHAWVIYYLISGIRAAFKLKTLPPDEVFAADPTDPTQPPLDFSVDE